MTNLSYLMMKQNITNSYSTGDNFKIQLQYIPTVLENLLNAHNQFLRKQINPKNYISFEHWLTQYGQCKLLPGNSNTQWWNTDYLIFNSETEYHQFLLQWT